MSDPFVPFRFHIGLFKGGAGISVGISANLGGGSADLPPGPLCSGAFSEASGLEATMTPRTVREGGRNFGATQLVGPTAFGTLTLKRGVTDARDLWQWFDLVAGRERFGLRLQGQLDVIDPGADAVALRWRLLNVLPVKFKAPDLAATANQVAIEEVQLVFEELQLEAT